MTFMTSVNLYRDEICFVIRAFHAPGSRIERTSAKKKNKIKIIIIP